MVISINNDSRTGVFARKHYICNFEHNIHRITNYNLMQIKHRYLPNIKKIKNILKF